MIDEPLTAEKQASATFAACNRWYCNGIIQLLPLSRATSRGMQQQQQGHQMCRRRPELCTRCNSSSSRSLFVRCCAAIDAAKHACANGRPARLYSTNSAVVYMCCGVISMSLFIEGCGRGASKRGRKKLLGKDGANDVLSCPYGFCLGGYTYVASFYEI